MAPDAAPRHPSATDDLVWYVAYGSNMSSDRLGYYLEGGRAPGASRDSDGARDRTPPRDRRPVGLDGSVYFARRSETWGGGVAFYDPDTPGTTAAVAHLVTVGQLSDIAHQEARRQPGTDIDLAAVLDSGRSSVGAGWYDTLVAV